MEAVKISKKYQVVIPEKISKAAGIKPGDKTIAISNHRVLYYVPVKSKAFYKAKTTTRTTSGTTPDSPTARS
jgi:AbrB family looped-hinge helix DNA binding protein